MSWQQKEMYVTADHRQGVLFEANGAKFCIPWSMISTVRKMLATYQLEHEKWLDRRAEGDGEGHDGHN